MTTKPLTLAQQALAEGLVPAPEHVETFPDGSALFACVGWEHEGQVWITNKHFIACVGPRARAAHGDLIPCPPSFVAALKRLPPRSFLPIQTGNFVRVGKVAVERIYFDTFTEWFGHVLEWRAGAELQDGVYILREGAIVAIAEAVPLDRAGLPCPLPKG